MDILSRSDGGAREPNVGRLARQYVEIGIARIREDASREPSVDISMLMCFLASAESLYDAADGREREKDAMGRGAVTESF